MEMACSPTACAASKLVSRGRDSAAVLQVLLGRHPAVPTADEMPDGALRDLTEQILRCCDRALAALRSASRKRSLANAHIAPSSKRTRVSCGEKGRRVEKQATMDDGFIWRKYGQKEICYSEYPRLYFRCTYKDDRGSMAKRQVQRSSANPSLYLITYFAEHTCRRHDNEPPTPAPFVINFGSSTCGDGHQPNVLPWRPSCGDDGPVVSETSDLCNSQEEMLAALMEQSTPVSEQVGKGSPGWDNLDGCLDWEFADDDSSFDVGQFINFDYFCLIQSNE